jgi:NADP-dependent 3-hydroxy acid dehydrogenase YdfG
MRHDAFWQNKTVAITGASSGIGEATARAFSAAGHPVLLMARRLDRMEALGLPNSVIRQVDVRIVIEEDHYETTIAALHQTLIEEPSTATH